MSQLSTSKIKGEGGHCEEGVPKFFSIKSRNNKYTLSMMKSINKVYFIYDEIHK